MLARYLGLIKPAWNSSRDPLYFATGLPRFSCRFARFRGFSSLRAFVYCSFALHPQPRIYADDADQNLIRVIMCFMVRFLSVPFFSDFFRVFRGPVLKCITTKHTNHTKKKHEKKLPPYEGGAGWFFSVTHFLNTDLTDQTD